MRFLGMNFFVLFFCMFFGNAVFAASNASGLTIEESRSVFLVKELEAIIARSKKTASSEVLRGMIEEKNIQLWLTPEELETLVVELKKKEEVEKLDRAVERVIEKIMMQKKKDERYFKKRYLLLLALLFYGGAVVKVLCDRQNAHRAELEGVKEVVNKAHEVLHKARDDDRGKVAALERVVAANRRGFDDEINNRIGIVAGCFEKYKEIALGRFMELHQKLDSLDKSFDQKIDRNVKRLDEKIDQWVEFFTQRQTELKEAVRLEYRYGDEDLKCQLESLRKRIDHAITVVRK